MECAETACWLMCQWNVQSQHVDSHQCNVQSQRVDSHQWNVQSQHVDSRQSNVQSQRVDSHQWNVQSQHVDSHQCEWECVESSVHSNRSGWRESTLVARGREKEIENSKSIGIFHRKARKTTFQ